jgi:hypothetical protein
MSEETLDPANGLELAKMLGVDPFEGVIIAVIPAGIDEIYTQEIAHLDNKGGHCHAVLADLGPWGERMMDLVAPSGQDVKWWIVKSVAASEGRDMIPIRWEGAIAHIPDVYFNSGYVLAVRFYQHGPFFFPKEKPTLRTDTTLLEAADEMAKQ